MEQYPFVLSPGLMKHWPGLFGLEDMEQCEREIVQDMEIMKRMYPKEARFITVLIEEACDRLEYEGSPMFDERPDRMMMLRMADDVCGMVCQEEGTPRYEQMHTMIEILLCNEFHERRCRHARRTRHYPYGMKR